MKKTTMKLPELENEIEIGQNETVLQTLNRESLYIYAPCGGAGTCGKCKVLIKGKTSDITKEELEYLSHDEIKEGVRLACKTYLMDAGEVYLLEKDLDNGSKGKLIGLKQYLLKTAITKKRVELEAPTLENGDTMVSSIKKSLGNVHIGSNTIGEISHNIEYNKEVTATLFNDELIDMEYGDTEKDIYGIAIDIGTTTVVCYLLDLYKGIQIEVSSMQNPQVGYGGDVISRINYTLENEGGLKILKDRIRQGIDHLIGEVVAKANIDKNHIYQGALVGNTTMTHLFWGFNCSSLSQLPFNPVTKDLLVEDAGIIGIKSMNENGKIVFLPGIAGFVGADTVGAMIAADLMNIQENTILIDLGTNGEIVLSTGSGRYACSTAAGPAFEGATIKYGMEAFGGAIDTFYIGDDIQYTTIGDTLAKGICGSGLIDMVSELLRVRMITENGKIVDGEEIDNEKLKKRIIKKDRRKEIMIVCEDETTHGDTISLTQKDIRELQMAKGAIRAGVHILLKVANIKIEDIDKIFLAGAFGNFINKENSRRIGLYPNVPLEKIISLGNAAGEGAKMALCHKNVLYDNACYYCDHTKHVEISSHPDFQDEFMEGMYLR